MNVRFLFASPQGDIVLSPEDLKRPFLINPSKAHPFLTLKHYFESLKSFILNDQASILVSVLRDQFKKAITLSDIHEILIRSEKHGTFYHLASVEVLTDEGHIKLGISTAISKQGKAVLSNEYTILDDLNSAYQRPFLPRVFFKGEVPCDGGQGKSESLSMLLTQWFEGYHEWHLSIDEKGGCQKVCIWDMEKGHRDATPEETFEIFRQAAKILALYYDTQGFKQIYPWHHAAGDFIVRTTQGVVDLRLTTVRQYQSIMDAVSQEPPNPLIAMVYFFLNLTARMRLDRLDGVAETVWAGDFSVKATVKGFFEALEIMDQEGRYGLGSVEDLLALLRSFSEDDFMGLFFSVLRLYEGDDPADLSVIEANLKDHALCVLRVLQEYGS